MSTQASSSSLRTTRGSSKPHCSSSIPGRGLSNGSGSTRHDERPSWDRATHRWEMPVVSSTRQISATSPSTTHAAGLNTAFTVTGQSSGVSSGLAG